MSPGRTVTTSQFLEAMKALREARARHVQRTGDPWAMRQALITVLELDTRAALDHGVSMKDLDRFDAGARKFALEWLDGRTA